ncbi:AhpC/TSA family protein [Pseudoflavitalea sp. G-6-1-2]|uniref:TlpA disulfide reductase family protein n=1 Tax=Pseudoflavitalea sp. G-6-1-2 TaxID=2728841 RepID=UPI00146B75AA|nr:TlpA disulfide reductase family protein [Pseudoflavitalea sp. G-6-1-2]NML21204.1 AhpC/TSA family protein [Pseudoflavitalea sp. G-6-1-2]
MKMRLSLITALSLLTSAGWAQTDSITISGNIKGLNGRKFFINWTDNAAKEGGQTVQPEGDRFNVKIAAQTSPILARLSMPRPFSDAAKDVAPGFFFIYNKDLKITFDPANGEAMQLKGDAENNKFSDLLKQLAPANAKDERAMQKLYYSKTPLSKEDSIKYSKEADEANKTQFGLKDAFVRKNPDAFASIYILYSSEYYYSADEYLSLWEGLTPAFKETQLAKSVKENLTKLYHTKAGTSAFEFERTSLDGKKVSPSSLKGKVYLLDFWGSWCGPCRYSHKHLKEMYAKYKPAGFEIVAVAQERGKTMEACKASWQKAIAEDGINWVHVLNQEGIEQLDIVKSYMVKGFPTKILIGADGKIITRISASASDAIDKALEKIYGF